jgi:hypothetical protein
MNRLKKLINRAFSYTTTKDIVYLKSVTPITVINKPSKKTIEYMAKMLQDFNSEFGSIEEFRSKLNIPEKGLDIKPFIGKNFSDIPGFDNELAVYALKSQVNQIRSEFGLSNDFIDQLLLLFYFNAFIDVEYFEGFITQPINFTVGKKNIAASMFDYSQEVGAIVIPFHISQNKLIQWIEKNWQTISKQMDEYLTEDPYMMRMHKNTELALEIFQLKEKEKLSFSEITNYLSDKYPVNEQVTSEEWVKKQYYQYKQLWNSLPLKSKQK